MARPDGVSRPGGGLARQLVALLLPLVALSACGEGDPAAMGGAAAPPAGAPPAAPQPAGAASPGPLALGTPPGFTPLPSPQQVVAPLASGRSDPFAPLPASQLGMPAGFLFTGVIRSRGLTQAIVYLGDTDTTGSATATNNGSSTGQEVKTDQPTTTLCVGPRGLCPGHDPLAPPLPPGWSVTGIDLRNGVLSLRQGILPVSCRLFPASVRSPYDPSDLTSSCTGPGVTAGRPSTASSASSPASPTGAPSSGQGQAGSATGTPASNAAPSAANAPAPPPR